MSSSKMSVLQNGQAEKFVLIRPPTFGMSCKQSGRGDVILEEEVDELADSPSEQVIETLSSASSSSPRDRATTCPSEFTDVWDRA